MSDKKISNPKTIVKPHVDVYNDEDRLNDLLISLKHLCYMYPIACQEASNEELYEKLEQLQKENSTLQRESFDLMFQKGWYQLEEQPEKKRTEVKNSFQKKQTQLNG